MIIIHYFLGFPPYRTGGMTKFAVDLMYKQVEQGNNVIAIWPGRIKQLNNKVTLKKMKSVNGIKNYEIINPLPVSLDEGIKDIKKYTKSIDANSYERFLKKINPDVIHVHTLMGLHKEFIDITKKLEIKTIYTAHDYFGICPIVTLYKKRNVCKNDHNCEDCRLCNSNALSLKKIKLMQSVLYRKLKESFLIKIIRRKHRKKYFENENKLDNISTNQDYINLRKYYISILINFDVIHFNSKLTYEIYRKYLNVKKYKIINISNKDITDNRSIKHSKSNKIRFTFLGSNKEYKGYYLLKEVFDSLWDEDKKNFELNVFCDVPTSSEYMNIKKDGFKRNELEQIFSNTDILIAPSKCYETFGYTVLEALSYGVPVIVSDTVGAKDIVSNCGFIFKSNDKEDLKEKILKVNYKKICEFKENIKYYEVNIWNKFYNNMMKLYEREE